MTKIYRTPTITTEERLAKGFQQWIEYQCYRKPGNQIALQVAIEDFEDFTQLAIEDEYMKELIRKAGFEVTKFTVIGLGFYE